MFYRQQTLLDELLTDAFADSKSRRLTFMASFFLSHDYLKQKGSLVAAFSRTAYALKHFKAIEEYTNSVNTIDDVLDTMHGGEILEMGSVSYGTKLCDFLKNPKLNPDDYMEKIERLVALGITDRGTAIAFSNLFAAKIYARAQLEPIARNSDLPSPRRVMSALNVDVTQAYAVFIYRCFNRSLNNYPNIDYFDHEQATKPYPNIAKIAFLGQVIDDLRDLFIDLKAEMETGIAMPNLVMAEMAQRHALSGKDGKLKPDLRSFVSWNANLEVIPYAEWPETVRTSVESIVPRFEATATHIKGTASRAIILSYLYNSLAEGMRTSLHPDYAQNNPPQENTVTFAPANGPLPMIRR